MAVIKIFENDRFGAARVAGTSEEPLFCIVDICKAVDIANPSNVKNRLDSDYIHPVDVIDKQQPTEVGERSAER